MSLKYVLRLSAPERPVLTRIAKGRGGRPRPTVWPVERARARLKCDAEPEGAAWERPAKAPRSRRRDGAGEAQLLQRAQSTPPAGQARGTLRARARERVARGVVPRIRYETVRCVLKKTN